MFTRSSLKFVPAYAHERSRHGRWMNQTRAFQTWKDVVCRVKLQCWIFELKLITCCTYFVEFEVHIGVTDKRMHLEHDVFASSQTNFALETIG